MEEVIKLFEQIKNTSSRNEKEKIIKDNSNNELFKRCLAFLLDKQVVTGISSAKIKKKVQSSTSTHLCGTSTFDDVIDYLKKNNTGTNDDIHELQCFLNSHQENREFYKQMITKKYRLGCDVKIVNKCIPNLIYTHNVMLGSSIDHAKLKGTEWISISRKMNGTRCSFVGGKLISRQGKEYTGLEHIIKAIHDNGLDNMFLDGELIYKSDTMTDSEAFQYGTGIINSKSKDKSEITFVLFDAFPVEEYYNGGKSKDTYKTRYEKYLNKYRELNCNELDVVEVCYQGTDHSMIDKWLDYAEENDWEGVMCALDKPYVSKRSKDLLKVKKFYTCDLRVIGYENGEGRNSDVLGAFICEYKDNTVNVGSGFSDEERKMFWENREDYIDRVIEIKYKEETVDKKTGKTSLQFPTFVCVRELGKEVSYE